MGKRPAVRLDNADHGLALLIPPQCGSVRQTKLCGRAVVLRPMPNISYRHGSPHAHHTPFQHLSLRRKHSQPNTRRADRNIHATHTSTLANWAYAAPSSACQHANSYMQLPQILKLRHRRGLRLRQTNAWTTFVPANCVWAHRPAENRPSTCAETAQSRTRCIGLFIFRHNVTSAGLWITTITVDKFL